MTIFNFNQFLLSCIAILISIGCKSQQQPRGLFKIDPAMYDEGFAYFVFPFNDTFIKANKIKTIGYAIDKSPNKRIYEFDKNGHLIKTYWILIKEQSNKVDTSHFDERIYNPITGILDTLIEFSEGYSTPRIFCFHYDKQNRLERILRFVLDDMTTEDRKNEEIIFERMVSAPRLESDIKRERVNKSNIHGRPVDTSTLNIMIRNNDFSSIRYNYYMRDQFAVEQQTEFYDFLKKYGDTDTCKIKTFYYSYNKQVTMKFFQFDCKGRDIASKYYIYKNGLLDSIIEADRWKAKDVKFMYDSKNNLTGLYNIWDGEKVSYLEMIYDEKGLIKALRRKSAWGKADYFMDATLVFTTEFF